MSSPNNYQLMRAKLKAATKAYVKAKEKFDADPTPENRDKERLMRGIVRGQAMMLLAFFRPYQHSDKQEIESIEYEYGFPHDNSDHRLMPEKSPTMVAFIKKTYDM